MFVRNGIVLAKYKRNIGTPTQKALADKYLAENKVYLVDEISILCDRSYITLINFVPQFNALDFDFYKAKFDDELVNIYAEPLDIYESEYNPYGRARAKPIPKNYQQYDGDFYERVCSVCGKVFIGRAEWVYKYAGKYACSYTCLNKLKEIRKGSAPKVTKERKNDTMGG